MSLCSAGQAPTCDPPGRIAARCQGGHGGGAKAIRSGLAGLAALDGGPYFDELERAADGGEMMVRGYSSVFHDYGTDARGYEHDAEAACRPLSVGPLLH